ncbi:MAG TPA: DNA ligase, partial [Ruminococcaceae bacterium]|nr:DNA ligase [Oscillospiraceae bacterium]
RELLEKHGANKLSEIDPSEYPALLAEAEVLGNG